MTSESSSTPSLHARNAGRHSPLSMSFLGGDEPSPIPMSEDEEDMEKNGENGHDFPATQPPESDDDESGVAAVADTTSQDSDIEDDQFLSKEERDRFFNIVLPRMQALALRLPELVKKPIPFLNQQEDSAVTLRQEQVKNGVFLSAKVRKLGLLISIRL